MKEKGVCLSIYVYLSLSLVYNSRSYYIFYPELENFKVDPLLFLLPKNAGVWKQERKGTPGERERKKDRKRMIKNESKTPNETKEREREKKRETCFFSFSFLVALTESEASKRLLQTARKNSLTHEEGHADVVRTHTYIHTNRTVEPLKELCKVSFMLRDPRKRFDSNVYKRCTVYICVCVFVATPPLLSAALPNVFTDFFPPSGKAHIYQLGPKKSRRRRL